MSSRTDSPRLPACSVSGCVDTADVRVSMLMGDTLYLCARHGRPLRAAALEVLADRAYTTRRLGGSNGSSLTT